MSQTHLRHGQGNRAVNLVASGVGGEPQVILSGAKPAIGKIVFTGNLIAGDTISVNGVTYTMKDAAAPAVGKIVLTGNIIAGDTFSFNGKVFTAKASGASGEYEFNVNTTLSTSLDNLITALNACTSPDVSYATYSKTDTNTAVTSTADTNNSAHNNVILATNHVSAVITQPTGGVSAAGTLEIDVNTTLSTSIDNVVTKLNASTDPLISYATYSKTDTNTALTTTSDTNNSAHNGILLQTNHSTAVVTQPVGGVSAVYISLETDTTKFAQTAADTSAVFLPNGVEGQRHSFVNTGLGTINMTGTSMAATNYAFNGDGDYLVMQFLGGVWRVVVNSGVVAS